MDLTTAQRASIIVEKMDELERVILKLEEIKDHNQFRISSTNTKTNKTDILELDEGKITTEIFSQNILVYAIDNLNVELTELNSELDNL